MKYILYDKYLTEFYSAKYANSLLTLEIYTSIISSDKRISFKSLIEDFIEEKL